MIQERKDILIELGKHLKINKEEYQAVKKQAEVENPWFTEKFIAQAENNILTQFLDPDKLDKFCRQYPVSAYSPKKVGMVMAGNIPFVGFHDVLCGFLSGHRITVKLSSKDRVLMTYIIEFLNHYLREPKIEIADMLKDQEAYIATGSSLTHSYFQLYFGKFPNIIRQSKTSVAILDGNESPEELAQLADDVHLYFGLGCRNVTHISVPENYPFENLIRAFSKYNYLKDHHKFKNNFDYNLSIILLNRVHYMATECLLLVENNEIFSPLSVLHYSFYTDKNEEINRLLESNKIQAIIGKELIPFGYAQQPEIDDFADQTDTLRFLINLHSD